MPELKRTFNSAKMNRDIDDRLLHPGEYRYAMNVNIGESEGGDIGAVENLKGNELITGQDNLNGTTIGVVRDPNNDRIYWFNKGTTVDGIYEYDERTGQVNPILLDQVSNPLQKPSCVPNFSTPISEPPSDGNTRPPLPDLPTPPQGVCNLELGPNGRMNTNYVANPSSGQYVDNSTCVEADPPPVASTDPVAAISGSTIGTIGGSAVTLSGTNSTPGTLTGGTAATITSYNWSDDNGGSQTGATATYDVTAPSSGESESVVVTLTVTNSEGVTSAPVTHTITFSTTPPTTYDFSWQPSGSITGVTISGGVSNEEGVENVAETIGSTITIAIDSPSTMRWATLPSAAAASPALPSGLTQGALMGTVGSSNAASVTLSGTWTPTADYSGTVAISGGSIEAIPPPPPTFTFFRAFITDPGTGQLGVNNIDASFGEGYLEHDYTGDWRITFTVDSSWNQSGDPPDFYLTPGEVTELTGTGPATGSGSGIGWFAERWFGSVNRTGTLILSDSNTNTQLATISFTQDDDL